MGKKTVKLLILLLLFACGPALGQDLQKIDSIKSLTLVETNDTVKVDHYGIIADLYSSTNTDSAFYYVNKAIELGHKTGYKKGLAENYYLLSYYLDRDGKTDEAIKNLEKARDYFTQLGDSSWLIGVYNNLGVYYSYGTDQKTSLEYFIRSMQLAENLNETFALSEAYSNVGSYYEYLKEYSSALNYYQKALDVDLTTDNAENIALSYLYVGNMYMKLYRFDNALENLTKALELIPRVKDPYRETEIYIYLANYYLETNDPEMARTYIREAEASNNKLGFSRLTANILFLKADLLLKQGEYDRALDLYGQTEKMYARLGIHDGLYDLYQNKANAYKQLGQYRKAMEMLDLANHENELIKPHELAEILGKLEHTIAVKEEQERLKLEQELQVQKSKTEIIRIRAGMYLAIAFGILLFLVLAILFYFYVLKRKHNKLLKTNYETISSQKIELEKKNLTLEANEKKLLELNATKDKFFSIIAHDLKNPFNVLMGLSDLVLRDPDLKHSEQFDELIEGMRKTATSGYNLLENLLEWSRTQTENIPVQPQTIELEEIVATNKEFFEQAARSKKIEIVPRSTFEKVYADFNMVNFVVRNLLNNAIKFSHPGSRIEVYTERQNGYCVTSVKDYGVGMDADTVSKLFKIEYNIQYEGTNHEKGTGLGLILCKEFVERNGGKIWVESKDGEGSRFCFSLPVAKSE